MPPTPIRVAFDATPNLDDRTGVGVFCHQLLDGLAPVPDLELTAYAVTWRGRGRLGEVTPTSVRTVDRPMPARPLRELWKRFDHPTIEMWTGEVDLVHGTNYVVPPTRHAAQIVSVYDLTPLRFPELCNQHTLAYPALITRAVERGAWVHTMSHAIAAEILEHFPIAEDRVVVIGGGIVAAAPPTPRSSTPAGHAAAGGDRYILALGTVEPRKNLPALVAAFDGLAHDDPELRLVLAGPDGWGAPALDEAIAGSTNRGRIVRTGWVDDETRAALLRGASVFAYPSRYEGFGFPPLEAMAEGIPVVTTDAGSLPEVVGDAAEIISAHELEPDRSGRQDPSGTLATALHRVLDDAERRSELIRLGRERATQYSWSHTVEEMTELYRRVAATSG